MLSSMISFHNQLHLNESENEMEKRTTDRWISGGSELVYVYALYGGVMYLSIVTNDVYSFTTTVYNKHNDYQRKRLQKALLCERIRFR